ncbi:MAG TPA: T9SS type A sorting domain-containing protein [Flavobacteriales bacterium]|nr:T9SS type A sorting domain-containing protein [Flavobacteriales bacterium]
MARFFGISILLFSHSFAFCQATGDYRSFATGTWTTASNWERYNGTAWVTATAAPTSTDGAITIQSGHTMQIAANATIDQITINSGGTINWTGGTCTIANGTGVDLQINGTFWDNRASSTVSVTFSAGATWQMGATGTLVRSAGNSSNNWQNNYQGGIANIPSTAFWILRKTGLQNPSISTTAPATGSVYPNLIIENNTASAWTTAATNSSFTGASAYPTVKGYLDIGGSGTNTVSFMNNCTNATPLTVAGNLIVRSGSTFRNYGTGTRVGGDITISGTVHFDGDNGRLIEINGTANQAVTVTGTFNIYDLEIDKPSGVVNLNSPLTVYHTLMLNNGVVNATATNQITVEEDATASGYTTASFINGPITKNGSEAFVFPTGDGTDLQTIDMSVASPASVLFTENFSGGAAGWSLNVVTGTEGADPNYFEVDDDESGVGSWACGTAGTGNSSLHVTSVFNPAGGAAYDAGGLCGAWFCPQANRRCESPTIDCTGSTDIVVSFNYIEGGETTNDNATLWYYDGSAWSQAADMGKTPLCTSGQGVWMRKWVLLPASANNNPNVKIAFSWVNNDDGAGTDPSFAVDDVEVAPWHSFTGEYYYADGTLVYGSVLAPTLAGISNCEYWILDRNAGTGRSVTLNWDANSCLVGTTADQRVARYDGVSNWQDEGNSATTGTMAAGSVTSNLVTSFSPFTIANVPTILPVEWLTFEAQAVENAHVLLTWSTATEINNDKFEIERTKNGKDFEYIGSVKGCGNCSSQKQYVFTDIYPYEGISYYRLKQVDYNGSHSYSYLRPVNIAGAPTVQVYPNPNNGNELFFNPGVANVVGIYVTDVTGKLVASELKAADAVGKYKVVFPQRLSPGAYLVTVCTGTSNLSTRVIVH